MNRQAEFAGRLARIAAGGRPRVLDLFSGCGGLSLGFQTAGCEIVGAVEFEEHAAASHGRNFHPGDQRHDKARDITTTTPHQLADELGIGPPETAVDIIVGGPPCQAFARVGRAKLREVDAHPEAFLHDPRAQLYKAYLDYVESFAPLALLMENVPDVLNHGGINVAEEVCDVLKLKGYICRYTLLNSAFYGVPQMRERMFLVAFRQELGIKPSFPQPAHWHELPVGYEGSRAVALKLLNGLFSSASDYEAPPASGPHLPGAITAAEAIGDLPPIDARALARSGALRRGARRFDVATMMYDHSRPVSEYAHQLKNWPGFEAPEGLYDHQIRYLPRDFELFSVMRPGSEYPELHRLATLRFEREAKRLELRRGSGAWESLISKMVPPYDPSKFPNKWWKLKPERPVRTLMAHLGKDSYSHIHYDSDQARTISVREAARLQSFPDGFKFCGTMNPAFRQIGNSVPPLMARAIAGEMLSSLRSALTTTGPTELAVAS